MKIEFQERIDNYLMNKMSDEERMSFEADLANDEELKEQMEFTRNVQRAMKSRGEKLAAMAEWKDDYSWEENSEEPATEYRPTGRGYDASPSTSENDTNSSHPSWRRMLYWISGIAAVFIVGLFLFHNLNVSDGSGNLSPISIDNTTFRSGNDYSEIEQLLNQKKYEEAIVQIDREIMALRDDSTRIRKDTSLDDERMEYKMQEVKLNFEDLNWMKAHALLGSGQQKDALILLDKLRQTDGYYQMAADSLYNSLMK